MSDKFISQVVTSFEIGNRILLKRSYKYRRSTGQFLTPPSLARFMARQLGAIRTGFRLLDPAIGSGTLVCAVIERLISEGKPLEILIDGYEIDSELCEVAKEILSEATERAAQYGIVVRALVQQSDFILDGIYDVLPIWEMDAKKSAYQLIIANPPYFKLNRKDARVKAVSGHLKGHTNIYTLFMALAVRKLSPAGRACFIVPRSFCSGAYFSDFRREFIRQAVPLHLHLFESRQDTFKRDAVLQENVVVTFCRREEQETEWRQPEYVNISVSKDLDGLDSMPASRRVLMRHFVLERKGAILFRLPVTDLDEQIVQAVDSWEGSLSQYGLDISTGPIVPFRARAFLTGVQAVARGQAVPLFWMQNINSQGLIWPTNNGNKPQGFILTQESSRLLLPPVNYVFLRRFSAKEESRRLIAAPFLADLYSHKWLGLENHLNYVYRKRGQLDSEETVGLSTLFNSGLMDRYFRIANGNTQVNAAELRALPLPPLQLIKQIGREIRATDEKLGHNVDIDEIVVSMLKQHNYLPKDFPIVKETRF